MKYIYTILFFFTFPFCNTVRCQEVHKFQTFTDDWDPFTYEGSYIGDFFTNLNGGVKKGGGFLGMGNIRIALDTKKAGWWKGGILYINGAATHGKSPSELVGDFQVVSNIDAGDHMFIQEFWYKQTFGKFDVIVGLQDMNAEFLISEGGGKFMNSSFGVPSVISDNVPAPLFPLTTLGIEEKWNINENFVWQNALFDGNPTGFDKNKYNLDWQIKREDGLLAISELQMMKPIAGLPTTWLLGAYYHTKLKQADDSTGTLNTIFKNNRGLYTIIDQNVWRSSDSSRRFNYFLQVAYSPLKNNTHNYYLGAGVTYTGIFKKRENDVLGLAFANAGFHNFVHKHEIAVELNYSYELNENIHIQPILQYLISPSGTDVKLDNALVGFVRCSILF